MKRAGILIALVVMLTVSVLGLAGPIDAKDKVTLECIQFFGSGTPQGQYLQGVAKAYMAEHPNVEIKISGDPNWMDVVRPRFAAGNPPDLVYLWTGSEVPLFEQGLLYPLDKTLETPAYGKTSGTWRSTFLADGDVISKAGAHILGHDYAIPFYTATTSTIWYNRKMFREHGWKEPETWSEFLDICADAKKKGIIPIALAGKFPHYCSWWYLNLVVRLSGDQAIDRVINNKGGFLSDSGWLKAAQLVRELVDKGYFERGHMGINHTESQMLFVQGRAAFNLCGNWLPAEMEKSAPADFEYGVFCFPAVEGGKGDPGVMGVTEGGICVTSASKNKEIAIDFLKFLTSKPMAAKFAAEVKDLSTIAGANTQENTPKTIMQVAELLNKAPRMFYLEPHWGKTFDDAYDAAILKLFGKEIKPEQFVQTLEKAAASIERK